MGQINQVQAQQVWQRVRSSPGDSEFSSLSSLISAVSQDTDIYLRLSEKTMGYERSILHKMYCQKQASCSCLKGIYAITSGKKPENRTSAPLHGTYGQILRGCYGREMRCVSAFDARSSDPEYGAVYLELRDQSRNHCRMILELIGRLSDAQKKTGK